MPNAPLVNQVYLEIGGLSGERVAELIGDLISVTVESSLHLPDSATLVVHDSGLKWIDETALEPGKTLKIKASTEGQEHQIFDGEIVGLEPAFEPTAQRLVIRGFDRLHRLARGRKVRSFVNVTDGDVAQKLAGEAGLSFEGNATTLHKYLFQNNETNLELLRRRAQAIGCLLYVEGTKLHLSPARADGPTVELQWAASLTEFHPVLTTVDQVSTTTVRGWDPEKAQEIVGQAETSEGHPQLGETRTGGALAQQAFGMSATDLGAHTPVRSQGVAETMAKALAAQHASRFVEAEGVCNGSPQLVAGCSVQITSLGTRFSGTYLVTSCRHEYNEDKTFTTHFSVSGQNPSNLLALLSPQAPPPTNRGLVVGIVTDNADPDGLGRVKVKYPWLAPDQASDWARVLSIGGGADRGVSFLPEVNDEVLVGFEQGDIHHPYILGGLWNGKAKPAIPSSEAVKGGKVQKRVLRTRVGHKIIFDDDDGGGGIEVVDKNGNTLKIDTSSDTLKVKVKGQINMESTGKCTVKSSDSVTIEGSANVEVKGSSGVTVQSSAQVNVKGAMINLN